MAENQNANKKEYFLLLSEIVSNMAVVFGRDLAILKARAISGIQLDVNGNIISISGYAADETKKLIDEYMKLSNGAVRNIIDSIFLKYPSIRKVEY